LGGQVGEVVLELVFVLFDQEFGGGEAGFFVKLFDAGLGASSSGE